MNTKPARESDGVPSPSKKLNESSRSATAFANKSSKPVSYTHTDQELQAKSAAGGAKHSTYLDRFLELGCVHLAHGTAVDGGVSVEGANPSERKPNRREPSDQCRGSEQEQEA